MSHVHQVCLIGYSQRYPYPFFWKLINFNCGYSVNVLMKELPKLQNTNIVTIKRVLL